MYQLYSLIGSKWEENGKPFEADSRRNAIDHVRVMGHLDMSTKLGVHITHLEEGTFKVVKV